MDYSEIILTTLTTSTVISGTISLIAKTLIKNSIKHEYDKKLKDHTASIDIELAAHKNNLKLETDSQIEKIRTRLKEESDLKLERFKLDLTKENIKFSAFYDRRFEVITKTYKQIQDVHNFFTLLEDNSVNKDEVFKIFSNFRNYFFGNMLYLPIQIVGLVTKYIDIWNIFFSTITIQNEFFNEHKVEGITTISTLEIELRKLLLDDDFTKMLNYNLEDSVKKSLLL